MHFKTIQENDISVLKKWFSADHVKTYWKVSNLTIESLKNKYLNQSNLIAYEANEPIGFVQVYDTRKVANWWEEEPSGTYGFDFLIGEKKYLGKGLGSKLVSELMSFLFKNQDIKRLISDPSPENLKSIKSLNAGGMNFLRTISTPDGPAALFHTLRFPHLETKRLNLRIAKLEDIDQVLKLHIENDDTHFKKWNPEMPLDIHEKEFWQKKIGSDQQEFVFDKSCRFILEHKLDNRIIGSANFTGIERGPFQNCRLGYKIHGQYIQQGLMTEALETAIDYMFQFMQVHRIEANYIPNNIPSRKVLTKLGFQEIGLSKK